MMVAPKPMSATRASVFVLLAALVRSECDTFKESRFFLRSSAACDAKNAVIPLARPKAAVAPQASMADGFFRYDQLRRSWYVFFFQTPLAESGSGSGKLRILLAVSGQWRGAK